ncbi:MAG: nucleoside hydrolase [Chloroflexota bacterium]
MSRERHPAPAEGTPRVLVVSGVACGAPLGRRGLVQVHLTGEWDRRRPHTDERGGAGGVRSMATPIILDVDPGHDDAVAIVMAAASPAIELLAVTCVAGNAPLERTQHNARAVLTVAGVRGVPVAAGLDGPLVRPLVTAADVHGASGLEGPRMPAPAVELDPRHAVDLIIELVMAAARPVTLVPTGPLSNVAMALRRAPQLRERVARIILMGGAVAEGNTTPSAEFNMYVDPEAAQIVFSAGIPLTMVGLDVTHKALVGEPEKDCIRALGTPVAAMVVDLLDFFGHHHRERYGWDAVPLHDPCCVAEVIRPGLIRTRPMHVEVETASSLTRGRTVCDVWGVTRTAPNADVGLDIDRAGFLDVVMDCLRRY